MCFYCRTEGSPSRGPELLSPELQSSREGGREARECLGAEGDLLFRARGLASGLLCASRNLASWSAKGKNAEHGPVTKLCGPMEGLGAIIQRPPHL